jgi:glycosyltransferase involved in cell wall biosynthesis
MAGPDLENRTMPSERPFVLHLIPKLAVGGATKCTLYQASRTVPLGYDTLVVAGLEHSPEGTMDRMAEELGVNILLLPCFRNSLMNPVGDLRTLFILRRIVRDHPTVLVHTHGGKAHYMGSWLKAVCPRVRLVHQVHGWSWSGEPSGLRDRLLVSAERWASRNADVLGVVTTLDIQKGLDLGIGSRGQYRLMRSGVDLTDFRPWTPRRRRQARERLGFGPEDKIVCSVGRLAPQKAPHRLVDLAEVMSADPNYRFVLVGGGALEREIRDELARRKLPRHLILIYGHRDNVPELLAAMDLVLLLSNYEGLPRTLVEALAMGLPLAARAVDGVNEVISDPLMGALIPLTADALEAADIVRQTIDGSRMDVEAVLARRQRAEEFGLHASLEQTIAVYRELLGEVAPSVDLKPVFLEDVVRAIDLLEEDERLEDAPEEPRRRPTPSGPRPRSDRRSGSDRRAATDRRKSPDPSGFDRRRAAGGGDRRESDGEQPAGSADGS